jgi:hypothetical protein
MNLDLSCLFTFFRLNEDLHQIVIVIVRSKPLQVLESQYESPNAITQGQFRQNLFSRMPFLAFPPSLALSLLLAVECY